MALIDLRVGGLPNYSNEILKTAPYSMVTPANVTDPGLLVAYPDPAVNSVTMDLAQAGGWCDGVTTCGSRDTASGIWNVAYTGNIDAINVLTDDSFIATGSPLFVGANGRVTAVVPGSSHYIIGIAAGPAKSCTLCDGSAGLCLPVVFEKVRSFIEVAAPTPPKKTKSEV